MRSNQKQGVSQIPMLTGVTAFIDHGSGSQLMTVPFVGLGGGEWVLEANKQPATINFMGEVVNQNRSAQHGEVQPEWFWMALPKSFHFFLVEHEASPSPPRVQRT